MDETKQLESGDRVTGELHHPRPSASDCRATAMASGSYRGIAFEIRCSTLVPMNKLGEDKERWTFYLYLRQQQFNAGVWDELWLEPSPPSEYFPHRIMYPYMESERIDQIDFHGGCTYYEKVAGFDGEKQVVKIGCDYSHLMDEGQKYSIHGILLDVCVAIDSLHESVPDIKVFCSGNGGFYLPWEGAFNESGQSFYSFYYQATKEDKKRAANA